MTSNEENNRYRTDTFHAKSLEGNPLNSDVDRDIKIYLPPDYYENEQRKYPVIYYLQGYGGNNRNWNVSYLNDKDRSLPLEIIPRKIRKEIDIDRLPTYEALDKLITSGELTPFIFIQPDGSLHIPHKDKLRDLKGMYMTKGSFYVNSPYSGNYLDYIAIDIINYIDNNYRTLANKQHRALMGGSMGGYGTIYVALHHPEKFISAVSLSPGNLGDFELLDWKLRIPIYERILGKKMSEKIGDTTWADILDTTDLIFSKDKPLIPSIKRDENGKIVNFSHEAQENWQKYDLNYLIQNNPEAFKKVHLLLNCESTDEFGLSRAAENIHNTLTKLGIDHQYELYSDPNAALSPHMLGIGYHIIPAIRFCMKYFPSPQ